MAIRELEVTTDLSPQELYPSPDVNKLFKLPYVKLTICPKMHLRKDLRLKNPLLTNLILLF